MTKSILEEETLANLFFRLNNAIDAKCRRTARARIRDIAKIYKRGKLCSYDEKYTELIKMYSL